ncbi:MAG TPA: glycosyltransferase family protein [Opitutaceae bacterium]|jgi:uncharacterized protein (TIGR00661 family)|nr:glycosyltransferase family protein [Opitutaceae bacterium]
MNIVYGISGEGLGHVFEAIEIITRLKEEGHSVKVLTYGERAMDSLARFSPTRIEGIHLHFNDGGLSISATVAGNLKIIPFFLRNWAPLLREIEAFEPDAFVTAYEPFTMLVAHLLGIPLVSMDNQNELLYVQPPAGTDMFAFRIATLATRICTHGAARYVVKSFKKLEDRRSVRFVAPVIQREIRRLRPVEGNHVLVYLTKENPGLIEVLRTLDETFIVYCLNRVGQEANITYRAKGPSFVPDLESCKAIIATTGFSLISDSIFLKKPYFGVPLRKQFEQTYNAQFLRDSGLGDYSEDPTREQLAGFLAKRAEYSARLQGYDLDPTQQEETLLGVLCELCAPEGRLQPVL